MISKVECLIYKIGEITFVHRLTKGKIRPKISKFALNFYSTWVKVDGGFRIKTDATDSLGLRRNRIYEPHLRNLIAELLTKDDIAVDLGANIGYHTLLMAVKSKKVYAFEPEPSNYMILMENLKNNNITNVEVIKKAATNKNGIVRLNLCQENLGSHSIVWVKSTNFVEVEGVRLDEVLPNKTIKMMKIDIEGAECLALDGLGDRIYDICNIIFEYHSGKSNPKIFEFLSSKGFKVRKLAENDYWAKRT